MTTSQRTTSCPRSILERTAPGHIPAPQCEPIPRFTLDDRLASTAISQRAPVVVVCAPAGSGKTALLHDWLERRIRPGDIAVGIGWLTVTPDLDRDSARWPDVAAALTEVLELPPAPRGTRTPVAYAAHIVDVLAARDHPTTLLLDDAHLLTNALLLAAVEYLIRHAPPTLTLILSGRHEPPLRWHGLDVGDRLTRVGPEELALTRDQAAQLFRQHGCDIADAELDTVMDLTHGWATPVRIAALQLGAADHPTALAELARPALPITEFLIGEVLAGLPWQLFEFLLRTGIPERFTESLADVLHQGRVHDLLDELTSAGLPVTGHCEDGELWFTYHPLLRAHLIAEIQRRDPAEVTRLREATVEWLCATGRPEQALTQVLALADHRRLERFVRDHGFGLVLDGHGARLFAEVVAAVSPIAEDPFLWRLRTVHALTCGEDGTALTYLDYLRAQPSSVSSCVPPHWLEVLDFAITADAAVATGTGIADLEVPESVAATGNRDIDCYAYVQTGSAMLLQGRFDRAVQLLGSGVTLSEHFARHRLTLQAMTRLALALGYQGSVSAMRTRAEQAVEFARRHDLLESPEAARAQIGAAITAHAQGDAWDPGVVGSPAEAGTLPEAPGTPVDGLPTDVDWRVLMCVNASDQRAAVHHLRAGVVDLLQRRPMPAVAAGLLLRAAVTQLVGIREIASAESLLLQARPVLANTPEFVAAQALITTAAHKPRSTRALLEPLLRHCDELHPTTALNAWLLYAGASHRLGLHTRTAEALESALRVSESERLLLPWFAIPGSIALLDRYAGRFGRFDEFADALRRHPAVAHRDVAPALTASETLVLKNLPSGRTGAQIAADLGVSVNTVKTHLRGLYSKLAVNNRVDAITRARTTGLL